MAGTQYRHKWENTKRKKEREMQERKQRVTSKSIDERAARFPSKLHFTFHFHMSAKITMTKKKQKINYLFASTKPQYFRMRFVSIDEWEWMLQTNYSIIMRTDIRTCDKFASAFKCRSKTKSYTWGTKHLSRVIVCHPAYTTPYNHESSKTATIYISQNLTAALVSECHTETLRWDISQLPSRHEK